MSLSPGVRLLHYEVIDSIGMGGMGEVYRARDTKLGRDVAIKILPDDLARDGERVARFEREAQLLAALNHPNIAAIYGFETSDDELHFLVLELVPGETLADKLSARSLGVEESLILAGQIAEAVDAAHEKSVIHRDLKPANIKVTEDGVVKVLDFGLAKALFDEFRDEGNLSQSPTITKDGTHTGVILGTAPYMSPEQAKGRPVDKRTDVFAFGAVLYEMLTGRPAFRGENITEVLASVLKSEPDWTLLPPDIDRRLLVLLRGCLKKDRRERRRDIGDVLAGIREVLTDPSESFVGRDTASTTKRVDLRGWAVAAVLGIAGVIAGWGLKPTPSRDVTRLTMLLSENQRLAESDGNRLTLSPDGNSLVYVDRLESGQSQLQLRAMDKTDAVPIRGAEGSQPFFSPDGEWLGFYARADGELRRVSINGGAPVTLAEIDGRLYGASWGPNDNIVFGRGPEGIWQVSANGGVPEVVVTVDSKLGEFASSPSMLPDGKTVLFTLATGLDWEGASIVAQNIATGERRLLLKGGDDARYLPTGHIVYAAGQTVLGVRFDPRRLEVASGPVPVIEDVQQGEVTRGGSRFQVSDSGNLAYVPASGELPKKLFWVDRGGNAIAMSDEEGIYGWVEVSPDGERLSVQIEDESQSDIWIYDIGRDLFTRLTIEGSNTGRPTWSPDGTWVSFTSDRTGDPDLYRKRADFSGDAERIVAREYRQAHASWSSEAIVYTEIHPETDIDLWVLPHGGDGKPRPFVRTPFYEGNADFSPDGKWIAYQSRESGQFEIYVQPYPGPGRRWRISSDGGAIPRWAGSELFYVWGDQLWAVEVTTEGEFVAGTPRVVLSSGVPGLNWAVAPDGRRFVIARPDQGRASLEGRQIHVVLNWHQELQRLVPNPD